VVGPKRIKYFFMRTEQFMADTSNYKQLDFGLFVPSYLADQVGHLTPAALSAYEAHLRGKGKAEPTILKYTRHIQDFILFLGERYLSAAYVRAFLEKMKKSRSIGTVNGAISALNGLFKWLGRNDCVVSFYRHQESPYREDERNIELSDFNRLLDVADERMKAILLTFYGTGIRVSELKFFTVEAVKTGRVTVDNKGKVRTVFLDPATKTTLLNYCQKKKIQTGVIFRNRLGGALSRVYLWRSMKKLAEKAGVALSKVFPHNLRHLFVVERYKADKDVEALRLDLGHSLLATTQRYLKETVSAHFARVQQREPRLAG